MTGVDMYSFSKMKINLILLFFVGTVIILVECATVIKSGIEQLSLNAKRNSQVWTASGTNGTQGENRLLIYSHLLTLNVDDVLFSIRCACRRTRRNLFGS